MIKVYSSKECGYCTKLKDKLNELSIEFIDIDIDNEDNINEWNKIIDFTKVDAVPTIMVDKNILAPTRSFNTIDKALELITLLLKK